METNTTIEIQRKKYILILWQIISKCLQNEIFVSFIGH